MFESRIPRSERRDRAVNLLESVGLGHRLDHFPAKLSGGERQRVAIARSLANDPSVLLADEPTGNLDSENASLILELIIGLQREQDMTLVLVTHAGACTLVNSNSNYAAVDLGAANKTAQNNGCPAFTAGNTYRLATSLDVNATCSGACANWNLTAALPAAAATGLT